MKRSAQKRPPYRVPHVSPAFLRAGPPLFYCKPRVARGWAARLARTLKAARTRVFKLTAQPNPKCQGAERKSTPSGWKPGRLLCAVPPPAPPSKPRRRCPGEQLRPWLAGAPKPRRVFVPKEIPATADLPPGQVAPVPGSGWISPPTISNGSVVAGPGEPWGRPTYTAQAPPVVDERPPSPEGRPQPLVLGPRGFFHTRPFARGKPHGVGAGPPQSPLFVFRPTTARVPRANDRTIPNPATPRPPPPRIPCLRGRG